LLRTGSAQYPQFAYQSANAKLTPFAQYRLLNNIGANDDFRVVAIEPNPEVDGAVLVGYANDQIVEFDVKSRKGVKAFTGVANEKKVLMHPPFPFLHCGTHHVWNASENDLSHLAFGRREVYEWLSKWRSLHLEAQVEQT
jgi:hypothetical protein